MTESAKGELLFSALTEARIWRNFKIEHEGAFSGCSGAKVNYINFIILRTENTGNVSI